jgi:transcriptional regulator PpsR
MVQMDPKVAARMVMASADVAVILGRDGVVKDVLLAAEARLPSEFGDWLGRPWVETVALDSRNKAQALLSDAAIGVPGRLREINHLAAAGGATVPIRYSAVRLAEGGDLLIVGRDLRALAALQQQLVQFQQSMEREYARLRAADTRYRVLFQLTSEPVLVLDAATRRVVDINPAALQLLNLQPNRATGRVFSQFFVDKGGDVLQNLLVIAATGVGSAPARLRLTDSDAEVDVSVTLFRQDGSSFFLVRLTPCHSALAGVRPASSPGIDDLIERLPEAFVVTDGDGHIVAANAAFLDLTGVASASAAIGQGLENWLGRAGVDFSVLRASLREGSAVRSFATVIRSAFGAVENVEVSAVGATASDLDRLGFLIRPLARPSADSGGGGALPRSAEQFKQLVGRVPLKELVRETTDIIEKLCIEAALELTGDNRASAADMLGLSRQGLYAKMHRFGIGDLAGSDDA